MSRPSAWRLWRRPVVGIVVASALAAAMPRALAAQAIAADAVRIRLALSIPETVLMRRVVPGDVEHLADGRWVPLGGTESPVRVIPSHGPIRDDTHVVRLRAADSSAVALLERVEFVVAPLAKP